MTSKMKKIDQSVGSFNDSLIPFLSDFEVNEIQFIESVFDFAKEKHFGQKRFSGEDYFIHPLNIAKELIKHQPDKEIVAAALLHDVVEDCEVSVSEIEKKFGHEVAKLVDGVTKISLIEMKEKALGLEFDKNHISSQIDSYRKLLTAMAGDPRVLIIKLYDRLHNSQTLEWLPKSKQKFYALETIQVFAPLAERIGMSTIKSELEDNSFPYAFPEEYSAFIKNITVAKEDREKYIIKIIKILKNHFPGSEIYGRAKHNFSLYNKLLEKESLENIFDLVAIRIIVPTVEKCYHALGQIHEIFAPLPEGVTDYIAKPRENVYQSLHSIVIGPDNVKFEIQIRTPRMHKIAEFGIAAHWYYKEKKIRSTGEKDAKRWIEELGSGDIFGSKKNFFSDKIFVFTPQGKIIELPKNATPLDFAFHIHSQLGLSCYGSKINNKIGHISAKLKTGDIVEIIKNERTKPSLDWLGFVKTNFAKNKIRDYFNNLERPKHLSIGQEIVNTQLMKFELLPITEKNFKQLSDKISRSKLPFNDLETALVLVGKKEISKNDVIKVLYENANFSENKEAKKITGVGNVNFEIGNGITYRLANCCKPKNIDKIIGYITLQKIITVHKANCPETKKFDKSRIINGNWC
ncbi:(p)ppGpp synthetase [Candidatus Berkelbacteria bacterium CG08_land_8_20_14_0_20_39_8]|uniref:(P)ppGpp synthetase n=1 Tax=Candidatus Berkelbacteria bacterium CG08_land_8_20_14_0_20_39_8 TaxID=1974511 RepID=A0A2M6YCU0_9BACT|nr:MAG: (p)ppGpp synthetase [Candidatus Berkelbacteria bacterium CG08_land_8_20_14_0_20_39_8]